jgi:hypothetical protein
MGCKTQNGSEYTPLASYITDNYDIYLIVVKEFFKFVTPPYGQCKDKK